MTPLPLTNVLSRCITENRVASAYLLLGLSSDELKTQALLFSKRLNCVDNTGCGTCSSCKKIERFVHPDVFRISDSEESIKVETLRDLQKKLQFKPYEGKWKVIIIENAESLNAASSNSLLKILEEPPSQTTFLLLSPHIERLLPTIISRCQIVRLSNMTRPFVPLPEFLNDLLSLPSKADQILDLAKKMAKDETVLEHSLEILLAWHHDLLFYKRGLSPVTSPFKEKNILGQNTSRKFPFHKLYDQFLLILEAKKNLNFQINRELLSETLLLKLAPEILY